VVVLLVGFVYWFRLGSMPLFEPDEARYGEVAREMLETGDWVTTRVNYVRYLAKPPLAFWLMALSFSALEPSEFAARLPGAVAALAGVLVCLAFGRAALGRRAGVLASLVLATSGLYFALALLVRFDMPLTLFVMLALFFWWCARWEERRTAQTALYLLSYAMAALATLTKGPIGAGLPWMIIVAYLAWSGRLRDLRDARHLAGLAVFLAVAAPWFVAAELRNPGFLSSFLLHENLSRYVSARPFGSGPPHFFVPVLIVGFFPWTAFLPLAAVRGWRLLFGGGDAERGHRRGRRGRDKAGWLERARAALRRARQQQQASRGADAAALCLVWFVVTFLFFSLSLGSKRYVYILPAWPALALLVGKVLAEAASERRAEALSPAMRASIAAFVAILAVVAAGAVWYERNYEKVPHQVVAHYEAAIAVAAALGILLTVAALLRRMRATAVVLMVAATAGLLLALTGLMVPLAYARSAKRLVRGIQRVTRPQDTVVCYLDFVYAVPFYLRRPVPFIRPGAPPDFIFDPEEAKQKGLWLPDEHALGRFLASSNRVFVFTEERQLPDLRETYESRVHVLGQAGKMVLFANDAGAEAMAAQAGRSSGPRAASSGRPSTAQPP